MAMGGSSSRRGRCHAPIPGSSHEANVPPSAKEEGDSRLSPPRGPSLMLEQRVMGLPSSSVAPKIQPGMCRARSRGKPRGDNPATLALTSLFLKFPCRIRGNPARREVTVRGSSHDAPAGCRAPLRPPVVCWVWLCRCLHQGAAPSPWSIPAWHRSGSSVTARGPAVGSGISRHPRGVPPCTYPVPKECPQKRMLLFPLRALAQS